MNNGYYGNTTMPGQPLYSGNIQTPNQQTASTNNQTEPYIEGVLSKTASLKVNVYTTFPDSTEYRDRSFKGILEASGRDHIIVSDPNTGYWNLIPMIYVDWIEFDESIGKYIVSN